jgi:MOSC domain-containing protein YiiM
MSSAQNSKIIYKGVLHQISISRGGPPKTEIKEGQVTTVGIEGDLHRDRRNHGGVERALCLFSKEIIDALAGKGYNIFPGALAENLTLAAEEGFDYSNLLPGDTVAIGENVKIQITSYTTPCSNVAPYLTPPGSDKPNLAEVLQEKNPGKSRLYARVLQQGKIKKGDAVIVYRQDKI